MYCSVIKLIVYHFEHLISSFHLSESMKLNNSLLGNSSNIAGGTFLGDHSSSPETAASILNDLYKSSSTSGTASGSSTGAFIYRKPSDTVAGPGMSPSVPPPSAVVQMYSYAAAAAADKSLSMMPPPTMSLGTTSGPLYGTTSSGIVRYGSTSDALGYHHNPHHQPVQSFDAASTYPCADDVLHMTRMYFTSPSTSSATGMSSVSMSSSLSDICAMRSHQQQQQQQQQSVGTSRMMMFKTEQQSSTTSSTCSSELSESASPENQLRRRYHQSHHDRHNHNGQPPYHQGGAKDNSTVGDDVTSHVLNGKQRMTTDDSSVLQDSALGASTGKINCGGVRAGSVGGQFLPSIEEFGVPVMHRGGSSSSASSERQMSVDNGFCC